MGLTVKIIRNGGSQAVRIPAEYRLKGKEAIIRKVEGGVLILQKDSIWDDFLDSLSQFSDDFLDDGRDLRNKA